MTYQLLVNGQKTVDTNSARIASDAFDKAVGEGTACVLYVDGQPMMRSEGGLH